MVMRISNEEMSILTKPVVNPEIGNEVPNEHIGQSKFAAEEVQSSYGQSDTDVTDDNKVGLLVIEDRTAWVKVVDTTTKTVVLALAAALALTLVEVVAGDIGQDVVGPAEELLSNKHAEAEDGSLSGEFRQLMDHLANARGVLLASLGHEDHVSLHVASGLVVLGVGVLPAEVGDQQCGVEEPAGGVVDQTRLGKGLVTALVGNDPETGAEEALKEGVDAPEDGSNGHEGDVLGSNEVIPHIECGGQAGHVAEDVCPASDGGALEAVLRDGIADVLDGVVGWGELVAIGIDQRAILGLGVELNG